MKKIYISNNGELSVTPELQKFINETQNDATKENKSINKDICTGGNALNCSNKTDCSGTTNDHGCTNWATCVVDLF